MFVLRASLLVAGLLVCGAVSALATTQLTNIDRELKSLCLRLPRADDAIASAIRSRLATLWRARKAAVARLPTNERAAAGRSRIASAECLSLARATAEPPQPVSRSSTRRPNTYSQSHRYRRSYRYSAPQRSTPPPAASPPTVARRSSPNVAQSPPAPRQSSSVESPTSTPAPAPAPNGGTSPTAPANSSTQLPEFFPWPPPAPSGRRLLELSQLGGDTPPDTWGVLADRLKDLLRSARYRSWGFYAAPGGFAVVTHIERLDEHDGVALVGDDRWASEVKLASTSILEGIFMVSRPRGVYRVIVFVLTTDPRSGGPVTDPRAMLQLARRWGISGALDLPDALRSNPITRVQRLFALVYEFENVVGGEARVNSPGRWTFDHHFENAGIVISP